jgi:hypothetical protein
MLGGSFYAIPITPNLYETTISAAGTNQAGATQITGDTVNVTTVGSGAGIKVPALGTNQTLGRSITIANNGANALLVYPQTGAAIDALGTNVATSLAVGKILQLVQVTTTLWETVANTGSSGGSAITVFDEGSSLTTTLASLNFVGAGVTATTSSSAVTVTIPGGSGNQQVINTRASTTATLTISSAPSSIDGVTLATNDLILVKNQTSGAENGVYKFNGTGSALTRDTTLNSSAQAVPGLLVTVSEGTANYDSLWMLTTNGSITLGTTALTFLASAGGGGGGSAITVYDEGSSLTTTLASLNFVGSGLTATTSGSAVTVAVPGIVLIARAASVSNVTISSAPSAIDSVTLASLDLVLLKNQTTGSENGLYQFNGTGSALTRAASMNTSAQAISGMLISIDEGSINGQSLWMLVTAAPITLNTTALVFKTQGGLVGTVAGSAVIDFGSSPGKNSTTVVVTGQTYILSTSVINVFVMGDDTSTEHTSNDHKYLQLFATFTAGTIVPGTGFTIYGTAREKLQGKFTVRFTWLNP